MAEPGSRCRPAAVRRGWARPVSNRRWRPATREFRESATVQEGPGVVGGNSPVPEMYDVPRAVKVHGVTSTWGLDGRTAASRRSRRSRGVRAAPSSRSHRAVDGWIGPPGGVGHDEPPVNRPLGSDSAGG